MLWSPNLFTYLRTWLISLGKQNLSNLMWWFTFNTLSLLVCFPVFFFFFFFYYYLPICGWISGRDALSQSSMISSSICTSGNPSNLFVLHRWTLNKKISSCSNTSFSLHFEPSWIRYTLQPALPFIYFQPQQRYPLCWKFQNPCWHCSILERTQCTTVALYRPMAILEMETVGWVVHLKKIPLST